MYIVLYIFMTINLLYFYMSRNEYLYIYVNFSKVKI